MNPVVLGELQTSIKQVIIELKRQKHQNGIVLQQHRFVQPKAQYQTIEGNWGSTPALNQIFTDYVQHNNLQKTKAPY